MFSVYYRTPRDEALRVLFLVEAQPDRLARLRECYEGRHDVLDALWWRLHPREASPRGVPDPLVERDTLQRQAFSREGEASPTVEEHDPVTGGEIRLTADELRLRNLDAALLDDGTALDAAIARFSAEFPASAAPAGEEPLPPDEPVVPARRQRWPLAALASVLAALLMATAALAWKVGETSERLDTLAEAAVADTSERWRDVDATTSEALMVFTRTQALDDMYPLQLPVAYDPRAVRRLRPGVSNGSLRLFAVLADPGDVCLIAVLSDLSSASVCSAVREFDEAGLILAVSIPAADRPRGDPFKPMASTITWRPNGTISVTTGS